MLTQVEKTFHEIVPRVDFCSLRLVKEQSDTTYYNYWCIERVCHKQHAGKRV